MKVSYFLIDLEVTNGSYTYNHLSVLATDKENVSELANTIASEVYSDSEAGDDGFYFNEGCQFICVSAIKKISKAEFDVFKTHVRTIVILDDASNADFVNEQTPIIGDLTGDCAADMVFVGDIGSNAYLTFKNKDEAESLTVKLIREEDGVFVNVYVFGEEDQHPILSAQAFYEEDE